MLDNITSFQGKYDVVKVTLEESNQIIQLLREVAIWIRNCNIDQWGS